MSWSELERLVDEAETDEVIRRGLRHCRSCPELILAARRLGYHVTRVDLQRAWQLHRLAAPSRCVPAQRRPAPGG
ncbi:Nif11-like leader peptide family natural product precursor [Cyanobium sp. Lug-B]|nr:Nif11-like leader peptide family natural product precursor [Cyanobium sp. Lug-B]MCP9797246.1 Nif11-like leader peptide family natural product precursor [Cyanobium sp. Lug-B]